MYGKSASARYCVGAQILFIGAKDPSRGFGGLDVLRLTERAPGQSASVLQEVGQLRVPAPP